jgi:hypothetical protein
MLRGPRREQANDLHIRKSFGPNLERITGFRKILTAGSLGIPGVLPQSFPMNLTMGFVRLTGMLYNYLTIFMKWDENLSLADCEV